MKSSSIGPGSLDILDSVGPWDFAIFLKPYKKPSSLYG